MNKKLLIFKISVLVIFIFFVVSAIFIIPNELYQIKNLTLQLSEKDKWSGWIDPQGNSVIEIWKKTLTCNIFCLIGSIISVLFSGVICFIVWFKDAKILTENAIDRIQATKETLAEEKRAKLAQEIAEKQAELEKLNTKPSDTEVNIPH